MPYKTINSLANAFMAQKIKEVPWPTQPYAKPLVMERRTVLSEVWTLKYIPRDGIYLLYHGNMRRSAFQDKENN